MESQRLPGHGGCRGWGRREMSVTVNKLSVIRCASSGDLVYSFVTTVKMLCYILENRSENRPDMFSHSEKSDCRYAKYIDLLVSSAPCLEPALHCQCCPSALILPRPPLGSSTTHRTTPPHRGTFLTAPGPQCAILGSSPAQALLHPASALTPTSGTLQLPGLLGAI